MAFQQFKFPDVIGELGLTMAEADLFADVPPVPVDPDFQARIAEGAELAGMIATEKAKSEFIIAPILLEVRRSLGNSFGLFSGVELSVDPARGLNGVCDFLITRSRLQYVVTPPILTVVEAKNDLPRYGFGQCIAGMVAAELLNRPAADRPATVYGAATGGSLWTFLRLTGTDLTIDILEYHIGHLGKIMGIVTHIVRTA